MLSLGNYGTNLAGGFTVAGLQALALRYLELKWKQLLRLDLLPALPAPSPNRESTLPSTVRLGVVGNKQDFSKSHFFFPL